MFWYSRKSGSVPYGYCASYIVLFACFLFCRKCSYRSAGRIICRAVLLGLVYGVFILDWFIIICWWGAATASAAFCVYTVSIVSGFILGSRSSFGLQGFFQPLHPCLSWHQHPVQYAQTVHVNNSEIQNQRDGIFPAHTQYL